MTHDPRAIWIAAMSRLFAPLLLVGVAGCCTDVFCRDHVSVEVRSAQGRMPTGEYLFSFSTPTDGWQVHCTLTRDDINGATCDHTGPVPANQGSPQYSYSTAGTWSLEVTGKPQAVTLEVSLDGVVLGSETFHPSYGEVIHPNGALCSPTCSAADATLTVSLSS